jgi:hypothetical protein
MSDQQPNMLLQERDLQPGDVASFRHKESGRTLVNWVVKVVEPNVYRLLEYGPSLKRENWEFVSAYRIPKYRPGQAGIATISACERTGSNFERHGMWFQRSEQPLSFMTDRGDVWYENMVIAFAPDDKMLRVQFGGAPSRADLANAIAGDAPTTSWHTGAADRVIRAYASNLR